MSSRTKTHNKDPCDQCGTVETDEIGNREKKRLQINFHLMSLTIYISDQTAYLETLPPCFCFL